MLQLAAEMPVSSVKFPDLLAIQIHKAAESESAACSAARLATDVVASMKNFIFMGGITLSCILFFPFGAEARPIRGGVGGPASGVGVRPGLGAGAAGPGLASPAVRGAAVGAPAAGGVGGPASGVGVAPGVGAGAAGAGVAPVPGVGAGGVGGPASGVAVAPRAGAWRAGVGVDCSPLPPTLRQDRIQEFTERNA